MAVVLHAARQLCDVDVVGPDQALRRRGWQPMTTFFSTVHRSVAVHASCVLVLLFSVGIQNHARMATLLCLWSIVVPVFVVYPRSVFSKHVEPICKQKMAEGLVLKKEDPQVAYDAKLRLLVNSRVDKTRFLYLAFVPIVAAFLQALPALLR
jgi:hypothetical protein